MSRINSRLFDLCILDDNQSKLSLLKTIETFTFSIMTIENEDEP